jgi:GDPmannose 4,6-dehydratase
VIDNELYRSSEMNTLMGDASKAHQKLNWFPTVTFEELVREMVDSDLEWYSNTGRPIE